MKKLIVISALFMIGAVSAQEFVCRSHCVVVDSKSQMIDYLAPVSGRSERGFDDAIEDILFNCQELASGYQGRPALVSNFSTGFNSSSSSTTVSNSQRGVNRSQVGVVDVRNGRFMGLGRYRVRGIEHRTASFFNLDNDLNVHDRKDSRILSVEFQSFAGDNFPCRVEQTDRSKPRRVRSSGDLRG